MNNNDLTVGKQIRFWLNNARYVALPQSLLPAIVAAVMASFDPTFSFPLALLAIFGIALAHLSLNLFDDYFDYQKKGVGAREQLVREGMRARIGKCDYLTSGKTTPKKLFLAASVFGILASACGIFFIVKWGNIVLLLMAITILLGLSYSAPPIRFSYRGLGIFIIALLFGPVLMAGIYIAATGIYPKQLWYISIPIGLLVANVLFSHDIMDLEADKRAGKKTLCTLINRQEINLIVSALFIFLPYFLILLGIMNGVFSYYFLLTLLTLPHAFLLHRLLRAFVYHPQKKFSPKWWMQPMEKWEAITAAGIDWFMIRWFLSRNLLIYFSVLIVVAKVISSL